MTPLDYMNAYLSLPVHLDNWEVEVASIGMYLNHGIQPRSGVAWRAKDQLMGAITSETSLPWRAPQFPVEGYAILGASVVRVFTGKGSPKEVADALWLAHRYGFIKNPSKPRKDALSLKDYCRKYTGLDCNGFVGNCLGIDPNTLIEHYVNDDTRLTSVEQMQARTVLVWVPAYGGRYPHIAILNSAQVIGDRVEMSLVQSSGVVVTRNGETVDGLRYGDWPKPVKDFKKDRRGYLYLPHGGHHLYPCNVALSARPNQ